MSPVRQKVLFCSGRFQCCIPTVSYTHLDVYKRQVYSSVAISSDIVRVKMSANKTNKTGIVFLIHDITVTPSHDRFKQYNDWRQDI